MAMQVYPCRTDKLGRRFPHLSVGNRCGHDPARPKFDCIQDPALDEPGLECDVYGRKYRPAILRDLGNRAKGIFFEPQKHLSWAFKLVDHQVKCRGANLLQDRSELREAKTAMIAVMALHMDLQTMRVGAYDKQGKFYYYKVKWLAKQAGISHDRAKTAIRWMYDEGILTRPKGGKTGQYEKDEAGNYKGKGGIKILSERVFDYFGLGGEYLKDQRKKAAERARARVEERKLELTQQQQAVAAMRMDKALSETADILDSKRSSRAGKANLEEARAKADIAAQAMAAGYDLSDVYAILGR